MGLGNYYCDRYDYLKGNDLLLLNDVGIGAGSDHSVVFDQDVGDISGSTHRVVFGDVVEDVVHVYHNILFDDGVDVGRGTTGSVHKILFVGGG